MSETIEDYQVLNLLGTGGFANVYRARSNLTGKEVAIKMIDKKRMKASGMSGRVKKEVEIHSRLKHPSVLELYNFFEDANYVYLVLELCHNGELQRYLQSLSQPFTEEEARRLMRQIVEGILYLHSHGILHRDLSLSNLLLNKEMNVKIADFGLATQLEGPEEKHFTMCGTPNYISPEIAMRSAHGLEADVWSLGCMLYTFLVGRPPFDTDAVKSTLNRVISAEYRLPSHLSPEAKDLIQGLLCKNPKDRIPLIEILAHKFMTSKPLVLKAPQQVTEMSIDSGHGTFSSGKHSNANSIPRNQPMTGYPLRRQLPNQSQILEDENEQYCSGRYSDSDRGHASQSSSLISSHPTSPPVRDSRSEEELQRNCESCSLHQDKAKVYGNRPRHGMPPNDSQSNSSVQERKYLSHEATERSCGGLPPPALLPAAPARPHRAYHPLQSLSSGSSHSDSDFSLNATKKVLNFDSVASSLHENLSRDMFKNPSNMQTQEFISKVQNYLSQHFPLLPGVLEDPRLKSSAGVHPTTHQVSNPSQKQIETYGQTKESYKKSSLKDKQQVGETVAPFNTSRLSPCRQELPNVVFHITSNHDVYLEFIKQSKSGQKAMVSKVMAISSDGMKVKLYKPKGGKAIPISDQPPPGPGNCETYIYPDMPKEYLDKYRYAARSVAVIRSKTPKVIMYTDRARYMLMDNSPEPDFWVDFYDDVKFHLSREKNILKIIEKDGLSRILEVKDVPTRLNEDRLEMWDLVQKHYKYCSAAEANMLALESTISSNSSIFPLSLGRPPKRSTIPKSSKVSSETRVTESCSSIQPKIQSTPFDDTMLSTALGNVTLDKTVRTNSTPSSVVSSGSSRTQLKQQSLTVFVADVGWATQTSNGEVTVCFQDGTQLNVKQAGTNILFTDVEGKTFKFEKSHTVPDFVKLKLSKLPFIFEMLQNKSLSQSTISSSS
ncbi:serine/threonine-protein kinase PLK4 [Biomphalaria pfeifferi]|uniref:Serine/threonine-protein kinase PLK4 n=1 Tax=Biomphalaria pfeifferi TaxID=112525 RepID=A0AAD8AWA9_BIOPF|nr:serine/threonine-protein kinase PLK4 [Biomphalaria pfeifferi]